MVAYISIHAMSILIYFLYHIRKIIARMESKTESEIEKYLLALRVSKSEYLLCAVLVSCVHLLMLLLKLLVIFMW